MDLDSLMEVHKLLESNRKECAPFLNSIIKRQWKGCTYYVSYAEKINRLRFNSKCFLVISINKDGLSTIGYVVDIKPNEFPLREGKPITKISTPLMYISNFTKIVDDNKLSITFHDTLHKKEDPILFQFKKPSLINEWVKLIIDLNSEKDPVNVPAILKENEALKGRLTQKEEECVLKSNQIDQLSIQLQEKEVQLSCAKLQCNQLQSRLEAANEDIMKKVEEGELLLRQSNKTSELLVASTQLNETLQAKITLLQSKNAESQDIIAIKAQNQVLLLSEVQVLKQKMARLAKVFDNVNQEIVQRKEAAKHTLQMKEMEINELKDTVQTLSMRAAKQLEELQHFRTVEVNLKTELKEKQSCIGRLSEQVKQLELMPLFDGLLQDHDSQKMFLRREIEQVTKRRIKRSQRIFRFDPENKKSFHHYVDNADNIVMIIKTIAGRLIAAFSESPFRTSNDASKAGLIFSLSSFQTFHLIEGKKSVVYDDYYLLFGVSQLSIKVSELRLFSNFGILSGCYDPKGAEASVLLGVEGREVQMQAYEVYRLHFIE